MVVIQNSDEYTLLGFQQSNSKNKKYDAILKHQHTGRERVVSFGDTRYQHYKDRIGLYTHLNHLDSIRRERYLKRHHRDIHNKFSSGYFSAKYLW
jgi:hypothetical protein